jgi:release factor glutamine methyltransferase
MLIRDTLREATRLLTEAGSDEAALESELLMMHTLGADRAHLYQRLADELPQAAEADYRELLARRLRHEPAPYITGRREFFGLEFEVTPAAIIPRPETETLVELALACARGLSAGRALTVADVGAGCGAIAVAMAHALPDARIIAIDISGEALALASRNAKRHGVAARIRFAHGDLLAPLRRPVDIIAANLPYVRTADWQDCPPEMREHEPRAGLDGGPDGLREIRRLLTQAPDCLRPGGALFAEIGDEQGEAARQAARESFPEAEIRIEKDLAGRDRVLVVRV